MPQKDNRSYHPHSNRKFNFSLLTEEEKLALNPKEKNILYLRKYRQLMAGKEIKNYGEEAKKEVEERKTICCRKKSTIPFERAPFKETYNLGDIQDVPIEKTLRRLELILSGERLFIR